MKAIVSSSRQELYALTSEDYLSDILEPFDRPSVFDIDFPGSGNRTIDGITYYFTVVRFTAIGGSVIDYYMLEKAFDSEGRYIKLKEAKRRFFESL